MAVLLFRVQDVFSVSGKGMVLAPGLSRGGPAKIVVGDEVEIRRPDGTTMRTRVGGLGIFGGKSIETVPMLVPIRGTKEQVPIGSEVWTLG